MRVWYTFIKQVQASGIEGCDNGCYMESYLTRTNIYARIYIYIHTHNTDMYTHDRHTEGCRKQIKRVCALTCANNFYFYIHMTATWKTVVQTPCEMCIFMYPLENLVYKINTHKIEREKERIHADGKGAHVCVSICICINITNMHTYIHTYAHT